MDPSRTLAELREIAARILRDDDADQPPSRDAAVSLAERVEALDQWISRGGFLPAPWRAVTK